MCQGMNQHGRSDQERLMQLCVCNSPKVHLKGAWDAVIHSRQPSHGRQSADLLRFSVFEPPGPPGRNEAPNPALTINNYLLRSLQHGPGKGHDTLSTVLGVVAIVNGVEARVIRREDPAGCDITVTWP